MQEALFYQQEGEQSLRCNLCPHHCLLKEGQTGICGVRKAEGNKLYSMNYGEVSSKAVDPIEKKPLYNFYPHADVFSVGTRGCNFKCPYCQNWRISQEKPPVEKFSPHEVVTMALQRDCSLIAYTYSEPLVWYEFVRETAELAAEKGILNVLVTNGYINQQPLLELLPFIDAANVDLKAADDNFYLEYCQGERKPVLETIKKMASEIHLEITTLVITDLNDDSQKMGQLFEWISGLDPDIPLHLSRYFPNYQLKNSPTSLPKMKTLYTEASRKLNYVYLGNTGLKEYNNTYCKQCQSEIITRKRYQVINKLEKGSCPHCGHRIEGQLSKIISKNI